MQCKGIKDFSNLFKPILCADHLKLCLEFSWRQVASVNFSEEVKMNTHDILSYNNSVSHQVFGVVIILAATTALLLLCGFCKRKKNDGEEGAPPTVKVEPLMPSATSSLCHQEKRKTNQLTPMAIPDYKFSISTSGSSSSTASADTDLSVSSEGLSITAKTLTNSTPTDVDFEAQSFAESQSALDTLAEFSSAAELEYFFPK
ncbi:hypothetical protein T4D_10175 [Trichinella pseudospiralis]|uniref:Uncharacterized protein n=2 Tax=Trichinella pseudospiralis TaxID=6337 RepID=A0A0V1FPC7_TRIPS|nr:hypothetical protein T4D_6447 [Trichinella pseudospiralis]KRY87615.1 hypothetical protein T4D_11918 [Trichinella pseudospiralis]KRY87620.1 hypothetical protein T4D_10175 [Trichinella pseudospiralis]